MALDTTTCKATIKTALLTNITNGGGTPTTQQQSDCDATADAIANAVTTLIKSATITYSAGLIAPSGGGPVTGTFGNTIS